ncbi:FAD-binding oxidoreductase [Catellatospora citrea]|uniref:FAD-binding oxidoreductase n=1 Tax=Catellatospora citrea TaxID=53366 RepID=UPI0034099696
MSSNASAVAAAGSLAAELDPGQVLLPGPGYDEARQIWNGAVEHRPALIVRAETPTNVQAAVRAARANGLPISVRGGGHDWAGRALRHDGLVIDLTRMRHVAVDRDAQVATLEGGALAADLIAAAAPHNLTAATGTVGAVGMVGLTLAGGYGPLAGKHGLALDNLLGADLVLADGRLVTVDATHEPELFWALRGGGGNFGVVTAMRVRLHPATTLLAGFIFFPWSQAADVFHGYAALAATAPDELTAQIGVLAGPDGNPFVYLAPAWSGDPAQGERAINQLEQLGTPLMSQVAPMAHADMLRLFDAHIANGRHYAGRTRSVKTFTPEVISAVVRAGDTLTSPLSGMPIHHFHGAAARVPTVATAFGNRQEHLMIEIFAGWEPTDGDDGARHRAWSDSVSKSLAPFALPGGYPNILGPDDHEQIQQAYGPNAARLRAAKQRFDPDGVFSATALPVSGS